MKPLHHPPAKESETKADIRPIVRRQELQPYSNEGGEFLDDAIRTEDLINVHTEENVASSSPGNLL